MRHKAGIKQRLRAASAGAWRCAPSFVYFLLVGWVGWGTKNCGGPLPSALRLLLPPLPTRSHPVGGGEAMKIECDEARRDGGLRRSAESGSTRSAEVSSRGRHLPNLYDDDRCGAEVKPRTLRVLIINTQVPSLLRSEVGSQV